MPNLSQYSQEFRAESKNAGPLNWQAGLYYFNEDGKGGSDGYNSTTGAQTSHVMSQQKNKAYAVFGSVNYDLSDAWSVKGGLRYTDDKKDFNTVESWGTVLVNPQSASESKSKVNWDVSSVYKLNKDVNVYGRIATGFRAPSIAAASTSQPVTVADAETITSYEAGIKADLFNRRARASLSVYDYDVKNQQLTVVGGLSNVTKLINAAKTKGRGVEAELEGFVTNQLKMTAGGSYNFTKIEDPTLRLPKCTTCTPLDPVVNGFMLLNGNPLPNAPKWTANVTARYSVPTENGEFFVFTDWSYRSKVNFFLYESVEFTGKALTEGGLRVGYNWNGGKYELAAYGRNITNQTVVTGAIDFNNRTGFVNEPRIWGVQFRSNF
jgi:iron complex outermembrane receptor protein